MRGFVKQLLQCLLCPIGLDATASHELLVHLNSLAASNRTVVLTIHQPRFEIFYMFHKLVLLSDGQVGNGYFMLHSFALHEKLVMEY